MTADKVGRTIVETMEDVFVNEPILLPKHLSMQNVEVGCVDDAVYLAPRATFSLGLRKPED